jgi:hypothetical protein
LKTPIINIQEAQILYTAMYKANTLPKILRTAPPYPVCMLLLDMPETHGGVVIQRVASDESAISISTYLSLPHKDVFWLSTLKFENKVDSRSFEEIHSSSTGVAGDDLLKNFNFWEPLMVRLENIAIFSLNLMNCKNIKYIPYDPNENLSRQVKHQMERKNQEPYLKYEILEIQPMNAHMTIQNRPKNEPQNNQRLHTVRGHFKTFTPEHPLFGRLTGTYWWGDCVKGNAEIGLLEKDYRIQIDPAIIRKLEV